MSKSTDKILVEFPLNILDKTIILARATPLFLEKFDILFFVNLIPVKISCLPIGQLERSLISAFRASASLRSKPQSLRLLKN